MTNYACHIHHLQWFDAHYLTKASCKIAASSLKDFLSKGRKSAKTHKLCIIMLINPSSYNFSEKDIWACDTESSPTYIGFWIFLKFIVPVSNQVYKLV